VLVRQQNNRSGKEINLSFFFYFLQLLEGIKMEELKIENVKQGICKISQLETGFGEKPDVIVLDIQDWKRIGKVMRWEQW
jgi:hypothetical protein